MATFDEKSSGFQRFGLEIFVIAAKAAKVQKLGVSYGLLGVRDRVGGGKQKITVWVGRLVRDGSRERITINRNRNIQERHTVSLISHANLRADTDRGSAECSSCFDDLTNMGQALVE